MTTPLHFRKFNDKIRVMNQYHSKEMRMTSDEARALHNDLFELVEEVARLRAVSTEEVIIIDMDAGDNSL